MPIVAGLTVPLMQLKSVLCSFFGISVQMLCLKQVVVQMKLQGIASKFEKAFFSSVSLCLVCSISPALSMFFLPFYCLSDVWLKSNHQKISHSKALYPTEFFHGCLVTVRKRTGKMECF